MLILTRKSNQSVVIGKEANIIVSILENSSDYVKLGIHAPREIPVHREEVHLRIQEQKKSKEEEKDKMQ